MLPEAWRGLVEVVEPQNSSDEWLQIETKDGSHYPILRIKALGSTLSEYGEMYDTESYYERLVDAPGGMETTNAVGNRLFICRVQRPEPDGCLVGPDGRAALMEPTMVTGWEGESWSLVEAERTELLVLLIGSTDGMDTRAMDVEFVKYMANQITFTNE